jgi:hypothetical protein
MNRQQRLFVQALDDRGGIRAVRLPGTSPGSGRALYSKRAIELTRRG